MDIAPERKIGFSSTQAGGKYRVPLTYKTILINISTSSKELHRCSESQYRSAVMIIVGCVSKVMNRGVTAAARSV
jgi:hypothetical protein